MSGQRPSLISLLLHIRQFHLISQQIWLNSSSLMCSLSEWRPSTSETWVLSLTHHSPLTPTSKPVDSFSNISYIHFSPSPPSLPVYPHHFSLGVLPRMSLVYSCLYLTDSPYPVPRVIFLKWKLVMRLSCWNNLKSRLPSMAHRPCTFFSGSHFPSLLQSC